MENVLPKIYPVDESIRIQGIEMYQLRYGLKKNPVDFAELSDAAKHNIREYIFARMFNNLENINWIIGWFSTTAIGYATYLELCDIAWTPQILDIILAGEFETQKPKKHMDSLFFSVPILCDIDLCINDILLQSQPDLENLLDSGLRTFEPLKLSVDSFEYDSNKYDFYAKSYGMAAKNLRDEIVKLRKSEGMKGVYLVYGFSYALPFIYCCRLAVELKIKAGLHKLNVFSEKKHKKHNIVSLWDSFVSFIPDEFKDQHARKKLRIMKNYILFLTNIDETGNFTRYPEEDGNCWLDVSAIYQDLTLFLGMMDAIDYSKFIESEKKSNGSD